MLIYAYTLIIIRTPWRGSARQWRPNWIRAAARPLFAPFSPAWVSGLDTGFYILKFKAGSGSSEAESGSRLLVLKPFLVLRPDFYVSNVNIWKNSTIDRQSFKIKTNLAQCLTFNIFPYRAVSNL
jgi:hypothetical protein